MRPYHEHDMIQTRRVCLRNWASLSMNLYVCILITKKPIYIANNSVLYERTYHIEVFCHFIRKYTMSRTIILLSLFHRTICCIFTSPSLLKNLYQTGHDKYIMIQLAWEYSRTFVYRFSFFLLIYCYFTNRFNQVVQLDFYFLYI